MDRSGLRRLEALVEAARLRGPDDRAEFLRHACRGDSDLRREVESLLDLKEDAQHFLDAPETLARTPSLTDEQPDPVIGQRVGRYEITGILGRGGSGVVYRAVQEQPHREVALKLIRRASVATRHRDRLLAREVQSLARMKHAGIAAIYEAGTTDDGRGFFAMELVPGPPLTDFVREKRLSVRARLDLFCRVCEAVQYAHQRGVIHRDIKPSNILIDADGLPKIIDFGLAKFTDTNAAVETLMTETTRVLGTLAYMSPEQAGGLADDIDVRSDVYSLGIVLFELLADRLPYNVSLISVSAALQVINSQAPPQLGTIHRNLRGDLEVITQTTLNKDPERRYQSAGDLAGDIRRHLEAKPINARRDSTIYVLRKYISRNRRGLGIAASTAIVLGAMFAVVIGLRTAAFERDRRSRMDAALTQANQLIEQVQAARIAYKETDAQLREFKSQRVAQYFTPETERQMHRVEDRMAEIRVAREQNHYVVLDLLRRAERFGADPERVQHIHGRLFLEEFLDELNYGDAAKAEAIRNRIVMNDPTGDLTRRLRQRWSRSFDSIPSGADAYLFRVTDQSLLSPDGEHRFVPVPIGDPRLPVLPGTWCLQVERGADQVQVGDVITSVAGFPIQGTMLVYVGTEQVPRFARLLSADGKTIRDQYDAAGIGKSSGANAERDSIALKFEYAGRQFTRHAKSLDQLGVVAAPPKVLAEAGGVLAQVWSHGKLTSQVLPRGLRVRRTSLPLFVCPEARIGATPTGNVRLVAGRYVLVLEKQGYEPMITAFSVSALFKGDQYSLRTLKPTGTTIPGFRYIPGACLAIEPDEPFWIKQTEVTVGEYLDFLNDPQILERIAAADEPILFPRSEANAANGGYFARAADGSFVAPASWNSDWPVFGVSWNDARSYARWRTERASDSGLHAVFTLPTLVEWTASCMVECSVQKFVFGFRYRAKWISSCYARPTPGIEPVMSFPRDESPYGVYDTAGSVSEWLDAWWLEERGLRRHAGGSWADGGPEDIFGISGGNGMRPEATSNSVGFRVVYRTPLAAAEDAE